MLNEIEKILQEKNILSYTNQGILTVNVADDGIGLSLAGELLKNIINKKTLLLLSGGRTPKALYAALAEKETIIPGAVGMIDERYGEKYHENSNENMLKETGFLRYLEMRNIPFYPILAGEESRIDTANDYDLILRELLRVYPKSVGILGIGLDGHTAGIPVQSSKFKITNSKLFDSSTWVAEYNDTAGNYGERVTMTFQALSQLDLFIVLVFGSDKTKALEAVFAEGPEEEIPGRFFKRPDIVKQTLLITDQKI